MDKMSIVIEALEKRYAKPYLFELIPEYFEVMDFIEQKSEELGIKNIKTGNRKGIARKYAPDFIIKKGFTDSLYNAHIQAVERFKARSADRRISSYRVGWWDSGIKEFIDEQNLSERLVESYYDKIKQSLPIDLQREFKVKVDSMLNRMIIPSTENERYLVKIVAYLFLREKNFKK